VRAFDDITGYVWKGETLCKKCLKAKLLAENKIKPTRKHLETILDTSADSIGIDRQDEWSFDSWNFPKVIFKSDAEFWPAKCLACAAEV
jgi:hypothetical protein